MTSHGRRALSGRLADARPEIYTQRRRKKERKKERRGGGLKKEGERCVCVLSFVAANTHPSPLLHPHLSLKRVFARSIILVVRRFCFFHPHHSWTISMPPLWTVSFCCARLYPAAPVTGRSYFVQGFHPILWNEAFLLSSENLSYHQQVWRASFGARKQMLVQINLVRWSTPDHTYRMLFCERWQGDTAASGE